MQLKIIAVPNQATFLEIVAIIDAETSQIAPVDDEKAF